MMKLNKEVVKAIYNVFSDCGVKHKEYGRGMATLHDLFQLFDGDEEIDVDRTTDLRPAKFQEEIKTPRPPKFQEEKSGKVGGR